MNLAFERGLTTKLRKEFADTGKRAAAQFIAAHHVDIVAAHRHRLLATIKPYVIAIFKAFWYRVRAELKAENPHLEIKATEDELDYDIQEYIRAVLSAGLDGVSKTTANRIGKVIADGHRDELSWDQIAKNIAAASGGAIGDARARTIARTELHSASQMGSQSAAEDLDIPNLKKQWLSSGDDRVRPDHQEADGQTVPLDDAFTVGGEEMDFPGDPSGSPENTINCRCVTTYTTL